MKVVRISAINYSAECQYAKIHVMELQRCVCVFRCRWTRKYHMFYGICYSLELQPEASKRGISELFLESYKDIFVFLHYPGQFLDYDSNSKVRAPRGRLATHSCMSTRWRKRAENIFLLHEGKLGSLL